MQWTSILAIYFLVWVMTAFVSLPFGVRTHEEAGVAKVPGQADSAPVSFRPRKLIIRTTIIAAIFTSLFVANYEFGWITPEDIDVLADVPWAEDL